MKFVIVIIVFAVKCTQVFGYPADFKLNAQDRIELKLPRTIQHNFEIQANGTLNTEHDRFTVVLPERDGAKHCQIMHDFKKNIVNVSPVPPDTNDSQDYKIVTQNQETRFTLTLRAKFVKEKQMFDVMYEAIDNGAIYMCCYVHFDDLGYIVFEEGVLGLRSILFKFQ